MPKQCIECGSTDLLGTIFYPDHCLQCAIMDHGNGTPEGYAEMQSWVLKAKKKKKKSNRHDPYPIEVR
tara:strand:- start:53 stop:256 length:204 start_codon:yes stop_codon:yes gene_type:complete